MDGEAVGSPERVNWGSEITPGTLIALEGVVVADMVDVDEPSRFQVTAYQPDGTAMQGRHLFISVGLVDDDGTVPTAVSSVGSNDGFPDGTRVYASSKLSALDGPVATGTVVLVGGDYEGSGEDPQNPVIRYRVGTGTPVTVTSISGTLEEGEVLRAVARHGRDGFMAVGDDGLILRTVADDEGRHDVATWTVVRPPWMGADSSDSAPDLKDVIKLGTGNLIVGAGGEVWLYRPVPVGFPENVGAGVDWDLSTATAEWTRLELGSHAAGVALTAAAADHVQDVVMPEPLAGSSDWNTAYVDQNAYALVVGEGGFLARFGVNLVERDLRGVDADGSSSAPASCDATLCPKSIPFDLVTFPGGTFGWDDANLNDVWSDERTRIVVGDEGNIWTFPKSALLASANASLWWDRGPPPVDDVEVDFNGVASDHSLYLVVGERAIEQVDPEDPSTEGVAFVGVSRVESCTVVGNFQRSCSPDKLLPDSDPLETDLVPCVADFKPRVSFSTADCLTSLEVEGAIHLTARMAMHAAGGSTEVYETNITPDGTLSDVYHLKFPSGSINRNTRAPFFIVNIEVTDTDTGDSDVIERDQFELLVIPEFPRFIDVGPGDTDWHWPDSAVPYQDPVATHGDYEYATSGGGIGEECYPQWEQSITTVAGAYVDLVYGRRNPTVVAEGDPQSLERLSGGARVIPSDEWVDLLTGRDASGVDQGAYQQIDGDPAETSDRCSAWVGPKSATPFADVDGNIAGFSRFRNIRTHGYPDDYERELGGGEFAYASLKHDFFGRCTHLEMPGEPWPDDDFASECCASVYDPEDTDAPPVLVPETKPIDVFAPFRGRVMLITAPGGPSPCNGEEAGRGENGEFVNQGGDLVSEIDDDPCPIKDLETFSYGSPTSPFFSRLLGRTLLVWTPESDPGAVLTGSVVMAIDNIDLCVPFNDEGDPDHSIVEAGERIGVFSNHTSMDVAMWVNDQHDRWRYVSYFDMLPDELYAMYVTNFGFKPRYSAASGQQVDPIITASERYYQCPALPFVLNEEIPAPSDPDDASLSLACQVPHGTQSSSGFTPDAGTLAPGRVWCPVRQCRTSGPLLLPHCSPEPFVCGEAALGGCTITDASENLACHDAVCTELACSRDRFLNPSYR